MNNYRERAIVAQLEAAKFRKSYMSMQANEGFHGTDYPASALKRAHTAVKMAKYWRERA